MNKRQAQLTLLRRTLTIGALLFLGFFLVRASVTMAARYFDAKDIQEVYGKELESLSDQEAYLQKQIDGLVSDEGIDYFVRDHYRVTKPGERLIIIVDDEASPE